MRNTATSLPSHRPKTSTNILEHLRTPALSKLGKVATLAALLVPYYALTHRNRNETAQDYLAPEAITLKYPPGSQTSGSVAVKSIDFSKDVKIVTERYTYDKHEDWAPSTYIGQLLSCFTKLFFMDYKMGAGLDAQEAKIVLSMLENNPKLDNVYVRVNHNEVFKDLGRLFSDPKVVARNNLAARIFVGIPTTFFGELFAELRRGDYYNPMTQTAVLYSNVRSVAAHELGHHQDFQRFSSDWWYSIGRGLPPVMIYQEWQASANARDSILSKSDHWQFNRYLMPAFLTYFIAAYSISKKKLSDKAKKDSPGKEEDVSGVHIARDCATAHGSFWAGMGMSKVAIAAGAHPALAAAALLGTWIACKVTADTILSKAVPYPHE